MASELLIFYIVQPAFVGFLSNYFIPGQLLFFQVIVVVMHEVYLLIRIKRCKLVVIDPGRLGPSLSIAIFRER